MEKDNRILDLAIHYALNNSYPATEDLSKYQKRAVRKRAATLLVEKGDIPGEKREESEGDQLRSGAAENLESMPLRYYLWTLWCHKDTQTDRQEVLLEGNGCKCEKVGKQCVVCVVYITVIVHAQRSTENGYQRY